METTGSAQVLDITKVAALLVLFSPADQTLLRRCSVVRICDRKVFDQVLRDGLNDAMAFEQFTALHLVEKLPGPGERHQLRDSARQELFDTWWTASKPPGGVEEERLPRELQQLSQRLADFYAAAGDGLEQLHHLAIADQAAAVTLLDRLCDEADKRFDLAQCAATLRALEERPDQLLAPEVLGPELHQAMTRWRLRLDARSMWAQEYRATVPYIEREETQQLLETLLTDPQRWILHLYAPGGMGKSMYIRSAIARHCVLQGVPCAKIDFDYVPHLANVVREPWRLLLRIAQQLTRQLPDNPFQELITSYGHFVAEADNSAIVSPRVFVGADLPDDHKQALADEILSRFTRVLIAANTRILLVMDTLENLAHGNMQLEALYDLLGAVHERCANVRVILAGRLDLAKALLQATAAAGAAQETGFVRRFAGQYISVQLGGFSEKQARRYLEEKRGLSGDPRVPVMIAKARISDSNIRDGDGRDGDGRDGDGRDGDGAADAISPFKLALLADITRVNPQITVDEFNRYEDVDLAYLIERVVDRIHDDRVKWLVRYGVVPRLLTRTLIKDLMVPFMLAGMRGQAAADDASQDPAVEPQLDDPPFPVSTEGSLEIDPDAVWDTLYRYTAEYSWVLVDEGLSALRFHPDIVEPMRRLLRKHLVAGRRILPELHTACVRYYEERAAAEPGSAASSLAEAVYHKLQASGDGGDGGGADEYWLGLMNEAAARDGGADVVEHLAEEALREPLVFDEASRQQAGEMLRFGAAVRARAHFELARHIARSEDRPALDEWQSVEQHLAAAEELAAGAGAALPAGEVAYLRGRAALARRDSQAALAECEKALQAPASAANELEVRTLYAEVLLALGRAETIGQYEAAAALAQTLQVARMSAIAPGWIAALEARERYEEAAAVAARWRAEIGVEGPPDAQGESMLAEIRQYLAIGQEGRAATAGSSGLEAWLAARPSPAGAAGDWAAYVEAEGWLAQQQPARALAVLQRASALASEQQAERAQQPVATELRARSFLDLVDPLRAKPEIETLVRSIYGRTTVGSARWAIEFCRFHLDETGNLHEAETYLRLAVGGVNDEATNIARELMRIRVLAQRGQHDEALAAVRQLAEREAAPLPGLAAQIALERLIQSGNADCVQPLVDALQEVTPATRRLLLLAELRRLPATALPALEDGAALRSLLPEAEAEGLDAALGALRLAEVQRITGDTAAAARLLRQAEDACRSPLRLKTLRQVYLAKDRAGWADGELDDTSVDAALAQTTEQGEALCSLALLEHAERVVVNLRDDRRAAALLKEAEALFPAAARVWAARIAVLRAKIAKLAGDGDVVRYIDQAAKSSAALGNQVDAESILHELNAWHAPPEFGSGVAAEVEAEPAPAAIPAPASAESAVVAVAARAQGPDLVVNLALGTGGWLVTLLDSEDRHWRGTVPLDRALAGLVGDGSRAVSQPFLDALQDDWQEITLVLGRTLFPTEARSFLERDMRSLAIRLDVQDAPLQWLPWELLRLDADSPPLSGVCASFYRGTLEGAISAPADTRQAAQGVLAVDLAQGDDRTGTRGARHITGSGLGRHYEALGARLLELVQPAQEEFQGTLSSFRPAIVHLRANLVENGAQAELVFGSRSDPSRTSRQVKSSYTSSAATTLSASRLGAILAVLEPAPLVILDVPCPPVVSELLRQYCLRNAFAAEWARSAPPAAILGVGLAEGEAQNQQTTLLVRQLGGQAIGAITQELRTYTALRGGRGYLRGDGFSTTLAPFAGTTLFADDPNQYFAIR